MIWIIIIGLVIAGVIKLLNTPTLPKSTAHGSARWAEASDLKGMLDEGPGLCVGLISDNGKLREVRLNTSIHSLIVAPSGAGKNTCLITGFLRSCRHSLVVNDPKGENYRLCKDHLEANGVRVVLIDPYGVCDE